MDFIDSDCLNEKIIQLKKENYNLNEEIKQIKNDLLAEKNQNKILNEKIKNLEKKINKEKEKKYENQEKLINDSYYKDKIILDLNEQIRNRDKIIEELNEIKSKFPFELSKDENILCLIIISIDQKIHFPIICKNTNRMIDLEKLLYDEYPEYKESENFFMINGIKINKYKTLEENHIKNRDIITLKEFDFI